MNRVIWEEICGFILLVMVFLAARYGSIQVVSAEAGRKDDRAILERWEWTEVLKRISTFRLQSG